MTPAKDDASADRPRARGRFSRRVLMAGAGTAAIGALGYAIFRRREEPPQTPVFLARNQSYDGDLVRTIRDALSAVSFDHEWVRGRRVLLKPNLVEPFRDAPHLTTHPAMVVAAAEVFLAWGAEVVVGEAPGHVRDTDMALADSGMAEALQDASLDFVDLNYSPSVRVPNAGRVSRLEALQFPQAVVEADLIVSMPKLKTHHWVGVTAAMKNLYGTLPGVIYGWPKNVLHHAGIPKTIFDINASLPTTIAIIDGILCMEGDGPILGTPKPMGIVAASLNPPAVDATLARIAGLAPEKMEYLSLAANRLGPIDDNLIAQRGESWQELVSPFEIIDAAHLTPLRATAQAEA